MTRDYNWRKDKELIKLRRNLSLYISMSIDVTYINPYRYSSFHKDMNMNQIITLNSFVGNTYIYKYIKGNGKLLRNRNRNKYSLRRSKYIDNYRREYNTKEISRTVLRKYLKKEEYLYE